MTLLNVLGSTAVARVQSLVVVVVISILSLFAVTTLANAEIVEQIHEMVETGGTDE